MNLIVRFLAWITRTTPGPNGRHHRRPEPTTARARTAQSRRGLIVLMAIAKQAQRDPAPLAETADPILMDGDDARAYALVRPYYQDWERRRADDLSELAHVVRQWHGMQAVTA